MALIGRPGTAIMLLHRAKRGKSALFRANSAAAVRYPLMTDEPIYDEPTEVDAVEGAVVLKGPDAVDVKMTPAAAEETSNRLLEGSMKARGQTYFEDGK